MVKLNKIYTKTGDKGKTSLVSGKRVSKDNIRIRAYGTIDELNSILGVVKHHVSKKLTKIVSEIQNDLFDLGADLATPISKSPKFPPLRITENQVKRLETAIDKFNKPLSSLNSFVLPGGSISAAYLHNARTVTRRAETLIVELNNKEKINVFSMTYVNRLSDLFFVLSRVENANGKKDVLWKPGQNT
jgi:cob(I)alamin adenosyltransferase